jgi:hypothetical protein
VDLRGGLDDVEKKEFLTLPGLKLRPLDRSARRQSLYRLRYPVYLEAVLVVMTVELIRAKIKFTQ